MKLTLEQKLQQKLSPQQIQMIKLIEVPAVELEDRIEQELQENPALEEGEEQDEKNEELNLDQDGEVQQEDDRMVNDDVDYEEYMNGDDIQDYKLHANNQSVNDKNENIPFSIGTSLHEHLTEQLNLNSLDDKQKTIGEFVIGNIDEDGYLRRDTEAMVDDIAFQNGIEVTVEDIDNMISRVQMLDPAGIGARTLQECLLLQIKNIRPQLQPTAAKLLDTCFEAFSKKHYDVILKKLGITEEELKEVFSEIVKLNPKPGSAWSNNVDKNMQTIIPDFFLEVENGECNITLNNSNIPPLRVSRQYKEMFQDYTANKSANKDMKDAVLFVKQKLDSAKWFIDALKQRNNTMMLVMSAIVERQKEFFVKGDDTCLKPMVLKDIAADTGLDVSTVSRVSNSKYIQTEFGVYPIKFFYSEAMQTESGEEVSSKKIKSILKEIIDAEDKTKPIADEALMAELKKQGFVIARRTIAKYREQLGIPVARLRKII